MGDLPLQGHDAEARRVCALQSCGKQSRVGPQFPRHAGGARKIGIHSARRLRPLRNGNQVRLRLHRRLQVTGPRQLLIGNCFPVPASWAAFSGAGSGFQGRAAGGVSERSRAKSGFSRSLRQLSECPRGLGGNGSRGVVPGLWDARLPESPRGLGPNLESSGSLGILAESPGVFLQLWARRAAVGVLYESGCYRVSRRSFSPPGPHAALGVLYESPGKAEAPGASASPGDS